jgi:hypothetical protein
MTLIVVDCEADGPCPGIYNLTEIGAVVVDRYLDKTFYGKMSPVTDNSLQAALDVTHRTRAEIETWPDPEKVMKNFEVWLNRMNDGQLVFISDNNGFDWQFTNYYFWKFLGRNPFGHSSNNLANVFGGMNKRIRKNFRDLRKTKHTHNPVDDAKGNAEAILRMVNEMGLEL